LYLSADKEQVFRVQILVQRVLHSGHTRLQLASTVHVYYRSYCLLLRAPFSLAYLALCAGMDFDLEDFDTKSPLTAEIVSTFMGAAVRAWRANSGMQGRPMPIVSINPGMYNDPANNGNPKLLDANFGGVRLLHDALETAAAGDGALFVARLLVSVQFYNCFVATGSSVPANASYYYCDDSPQGLAQIKGTYADILGRMQGTGFSSANLLVGKPAAQCCTTAADGQCSGASGTACAPMCSPNWGPNTAPQEYCGFDTASALRSLVAGHTDAGIVAGGGVYLWQWNDAYGEAPASPTRSPALCCHSHAHSFRCELFAALTAAAVSLVLCPPCTGSPLTEHAPAFAAAYTGAPAPAPTPPPAPTPDVFGTYTVVSGDSCYAIAGKVCAGQAANWAKVVCHSATECAALSVGEVLHYDCGGLGAHCSLLA
jgi:hypothetical protein